MKYRASAWVLFVALLLLGGSLPAIAHEGHHAKSLNAGTGSSAIDPQVLRAIQAYWEAFKARSTEMLSRVVTSDLLVLEGTTKNISWQDFRDNHIGPEMKEWTQFSVKSWKVIRSEVVGGFAYVASESQYEIVTAKEHVDLVGTETFILVKNSHSSDWMIKHVHSSGKRAQPKS